MKNLLNQNKEYLNIALNKIEYIDQFLRQNGFNDYLVVGSSALLACGYPLNRPVHDIDVEVLCTTEEEKIFKALADAWGNTYYQIKEDYPEKTGFDRKPYIFKIKDIIVNVWCVKEFTHSTIVSIGNTKFATLMSILEKKMSYKRNKDISDAIDFASLILNMCKNG